MNRPDFITLVKEPSAIMKMDPSEIKNIIDQYPYFQTAHMIYSAFLSSSDDILLYDQLKTSAAHINDRSMLYWLLCGQQQVSEKVEPEIKIKTVETSEQVKEEETVIPEETNIAIATTSLEPVAAEEIISAISNKVVSFVNL